MDKSRSLIKLQDLQLSNKLDNKIRILLSILNFQLDQIRVSLPQARSQLRLPSLHSSHLSIIKSYCQTSNRQYLRISSETQRITSTRPQRNQSGSSQSLMTRISRRIFAPWTSRPFRGYLLTSKKGIVAKINEDMEPYSFIVSENGSYCLHQIAQTYIIRIMQEVIRLTEHAPLLNLKKTKVIQRDLFIAKLTSNDKEMDIKLAEKTARDLVQLIIQQVKDEEIQAFKDQIEGEQKLFKLKTITKNIENLVLQIADAKLPNPF